MLKKTFLIFLYLLLSFALLTVVVDAANDIPTTKTAAKPQALLQLSIIKAEEAWLNNKQVISIVFSHNLSKNSDFNRFVTVTENGISLKGQWIQSESKQSLYLQNIKPGNKYEIFIRPGIKASNGLKLLSPKHFSITAKHAVPELKFVDEGNVFSINTAPTLQLNSINVGQQKIAIYKLQVDKADVLLKKLQQSPEIASWDSGSLNEFSELTFEKNIETNQAEDRRVNHQIVFLEHDKKPSAGLYFITIKGKTDKGDSIKQLSYFILSNFRLYAESLPASLELFSVSRKTAKLLPNVKLDIITNDAIRQVKTNKQGFAQVLQKKSSVISWIFAKYNQQLFLKKAPLIQHEYNDLTSDTAKIFLNKKRYKLGDKVVFSIITRDKNNKAIIDDTLRVVLLDSSNTVISEKKMITPELGNVSGFFQLPKEAKTNVGKQKAWHLAVYLHSQDKEVISTADFDVFASSYSNASLDFINESSIFNHSEKTKFIINGFIDNGVVAKSAPVVIKQNIKWLRHPSFKYKDYNFGIPSDKTLQGEHIMQTLTLDSDGKSKFVLPKIKNEVNSVLAVTLQAELKQEGSSIAKQTKKLIYWPTNTMVGVRTLNWGSEDVAFGITIDLININPQEELLAASNLEIKVEQLSEKTHWKYVQEFGWEREEKNHTNLIEKRTLSLLANQKNTIDLALDAGNYRVSIINPETALQTSYDFTVGNSMGDELEPDQLRLSLNHKSYQPTETALLSIESALSGEAIILLTSESIIYRQQKINLSKGQTQVEIPLDKLFSKHKNIPTNLQLSVHAFHNIDGNEFAASGQTKLVIDKPKVELSAMLTPSKNMVNIHSSKYKNTWGIIVIRAHSQDENKKDTGRDLTALTQTVFFDKNGYAVVNNQGNKISVKQHYLVDIYFVDDIEKNIQFNWLKPDLYLN